MTIFNLQCDLKEVESIENHIKSSNVIDITLRRQVRNSNNLSLGHTVVLDLLGHNFYHPMGKE